MTTGYEVHHDARVVFPALTPVVIQQTQLRGGATHVTVSRTKTESTTMRLFRFRDRAHWHIVRFEGQLMICFLEERHEEKKGEAFTVWRKLLYPLESAVFHELDPAHVLENLTRLVASHTGWSAVLQVDYLHLLAPRSASRQQEAQRLLSLGVDVNPPLLVF